MPKHSILLLVVFLAYFYIATAQEHPVKSVLKAPDNWQTEVLTFPLSFAPEIPYSGFEDLRFVPGWSDRDSDQFWAYMFVWVVDQSALLTSDSLTENVNQYYDGLMRIERRNAEEGLDISHTQSEFTKTDGGFQGKVHTWDAFFTKADMT